MHVTANKKHMPVGRKWNGGVFYEKVERGCFFVKKSGKWEVFFCKKVDLSSTQGALCTVSVFFILHFTYSGGA